LACAIAPEPCSRLSNKATCNFAPRVKLIDARYTSEYNIGQGRCGKPGEAKMIIPFTNPEIVGRVVFDWHIVKHEDKGMDGDRGGEIGKFQPGGIFFAERL